MNGDPPLNLTVEIESSCTFFVGIEEYTNVIKLHTPDEGEDLVEISVAFTRETNDKRSPEAGIRHQFSNPVNLAFIHAAVSAALH